MSTKQPTTTKFITSSPHVLSPTGEYTFVDNWEYCPHPITPARHVVVAIDPLFQFPTSPKPVNLQSCNRFRWGGLSYTADVYAERTQGQIDLDELMEEVTEKGYKPPPPEVLNEAKRIFRALRGNDPERRFSISPGPEGDISLDSQIDRDYVLLVCDPNGGALCLTDICGDQADRTYSTTFELPDIFINEAFRKLDDIHMRHDQSC